MNRNSRPRPQVASTCHCIKHCKNGWPKKFIWTKSPSTSWKLSQSSSKVHFYPKKTWIFIGNSLFNTRWRSGFYPYKKITNVKVAPSVITIVNPSGWRSEFCPYKTEIKVTVAPSLITIVNQFEFHFHIYFIFLAKKYLNWLPNGKARFKLKL